MVLCYTVCEGLTIHQAPFLVLRADCFFNSPNYTPCTTDSMVLISLCKRRKSQYNWASCLNLHSKQEPLPNTISTFQITHQGDWQFLEKQFSRSRSSELAQHCIWGVIRSAVQPAQCLLNSSSIVLSTFASFRNKMTMLTNNYVKITRREHCQCFQK